MAMASPLTGCKAKAAPKEAPANKAAGVRILLKIPDASPEKSFVSAATRPSTLRQGTFRLEALMACAGAMKDEQSKIVATAITPLEREGCCADSLENNAPTNIRRPDNNKRAGTAPARSRSSILLCCRRRRRRRLRRTEVEAEAQAEASAEEELLLSCI